MSKQRAKSFLYILALTILVAFCGCNQKSSVNEVQKDFDQFLEEMFINEVQSDSITLNYTLTNPEKYEITDFKPTLGEYSLEYMQTYNAVLENYKARLNEYNYKSLRDDQKITYDVLETYLDTNLTEEDFSLYSEILGPTTGIQSQLPVLLSEYNLNDESDINEYLALLSCVDDYFTQIVAFEKEKSKNGLFMSDPVADQIIKQCTLFMNAKENNALIEVFNDRMDDFDWLNKETKKEYKKENKKLVLNEIIPAYQLLVDGLNSLKGTGVNEEGLAHLPKGKEYYEYLVKYNTGSARSIPEISKGLKATIDESFLTIQSIVKKNPSILETISSAKFSLTDPSEILEFLKEDIKNDYPLPGAVDYTIKYVHPSLEEYLSPAFYLSPPIDNFSKNSIYINGYSSFDLSDIFTTLAHEGYPGHLYQTVYFNETNPAPIRNILNFSGYSEGWASYAEFDSYKRTGLDADTAELLKANQIATICMYGDIDLGVNYYGWSLKDTADYLSKFGVTNSSDIKNVYNAMVEEPGNYMKYAGGYLEIMELKKKAVKMKGENFNTKDFHQFILNFGPAPFNVIEKYMKKNL